MLAKDKFLLRRGKPKTDESFMGYILRLTEQNGYETPTWIFNIISPGNEQLNQNCKIVFEPTKYLNSLAQIINIPVNELRQLIYPYSTDSDGAQTYYFFGQKVSKYAIRRTHLKICPDCLLEAAYFRRIWELSTITTCPVHERLLIDACPHCNERISWSRKTVCICPCGFDWRMSPPTPIKEPELRLARHIYRVCRLPLDNYLTSNSVIKNHIYNLPLQGTLSALFFIAGQHQGLSLSTNKNLRPSGRNEDLHLIFTKAFSVFEDWPNTYYLFLDWVRERAKSIPLNRQRQKSVLYREFGNFYGSLFKILSGSQFEFMRRAFVEYLKGRWEGYLVFSNSPKGGEMPYCKSKYISIKDAIRLLATDEEQVRWLVKMGKIRTIILSKGKRRFVFTELMDVVNFMTSS